MKSCSDGTKTNKHSKKVEVMHRTIRMIKKPLLSILNPRNMYILEPVSYMLIVTNGIIDVCSTRSYNAFTREFQIVLYFPVVNGFY